MKTAWATASFIPGFGHPQKCLWSVNCNIGKSLSGICKLHQKIKARVMMQLLSLGYSLCENYRILPGNCADTLDQQHWRGMHAAWASPTWNCVKKSQAKVACYLLCVFTRLVLSKQLPAFRVSCLFWFGDFSLVPYIEAFTISMGVECCQVSSW